MKKYLLGITAVALAIAFSAFTVPAKQTFTGYKFKYVPTSLFSQSDVADVTNWTQVASQGCNQSQSDRPCTFIVVDEKKVHDDGFGGRILNDAVYMSSGSVEPNDELATINTIQGHLGGTPSTANHVVDASNPSTTTTTIENRLQ